MSRHPSKLLSRVRSRWRRSRRGRLVLGSAAIIGLVASPFALAVGEGSPFVAGVRNPSGGTSTELTRETQIIGNVAKDQGGVGAGTGGFTTRQSNKSSSGGGAIYGCRAQANTEACVAANNLANGHAFRFQVNPTADAVGEMRFGLSLNTPVAKPPFLTNGTGLVKNLNADQVDGKGAEDFAPAAATPLFAVVAADGTIAANRGVPANGRATVENVGLPPASTRFSVPFGIDVSACAYTVSPSADGLVEPAHVATGADKKSVVVTQDTLSQVGFHLQVIC